MSTATRSRSRRENYQAEGLAVLAWLNDLDRPDPADRVAAVRNLGVMCTGNDDPIVIEALTGRLADASAPVRAAAATALSAGGRLTTAARASLLRLIRDPHPDVRLAAIGAVMTALGPDLVPALADALGDDDADVRAASLDALHQLGPQARSEITKASQLFEDPVADIRAAALAFVAAVAADGLDVGRVLPLLRDDDAAVRRAAIGLLAKSPSTSQQVLEGLCERLTDPSAEVRLAAATALARRGDAASPATLALLAATRDASPLVQHAARTGVATLNERARPWLPYLLEILRSLEPGERSLIDHADKLIRCSIDPGIGGDFSIGTIAEFFCEILDHPNEVVVWNGGIGLSTVGSAAAIAGQKLVSLLASEVTHQRVCGVCGFLGMGPAALPWLYVLLRHVTDPDPLSRQWR